MVTVLIVVVVPFTVKFPSMVALPPTSKSLDPERVTGALNVLVALTERASPDASPIVV